MYNESNKTELKIELVDNVKKEIIAFLNLINKDANPEYKVSWGAVILFLPIAGAILYFLFYIKQLLELL